jgi:alpha-glucosidase (family GH31 glycosyl hydrolase)
MYFPKNSSWFDFFNDKKYEGGTTQPVPVSEDHIPVLRAAVLLFR